MPKRNSSSSGQSQASKATASRGNGPSRSPNVQPAGNRSSVPGNARNSRNAPSTKPPTMSNQPSYSNTFQHPARGPPQSQARSPNVVKSQATGNHTKVQPTNNRSHNVAGAKGGQRAFQDQSPRQTTPKGNSTGNGPTSPPKIQAYAPKPSASTTYSAAKQPASVSPKSNVGKQSQHISGGPSVSTPKSTKPHAVEARGTNGAFHGPSSPAVGQHGMNGKVHGQKSQSHAHGPPKSQMATHVLHGGSPSNVPKSPSHASQSKVHETSSKSFNGKISNPQTDNQSRGSGVTVSSSSDKKVTLPATTSPPHPTKSKGTGNRSHSHMATTNRSPSLSGSNRASSNSSTGDGRFLSTVSRVGQGMASAFTAAPASSHPSRNSGHPDTARQALNTKPLSKSPVAMKQSPNRNNNQAPSNALTKSHVVVDQSANSGIWNGISSLFGWSGSTPAVDKGACMTNQTGSKSRKVQEPPTTAHRSSTASRGSNGDSSKNVTAKAHSSNLRPLADNRSQGRDATVASSSIKNVTSPVKTPPLPDLSKSKGTGSRSSNLNHIATTNGSPSLSGSPSAKHAPRSPSTGNGRFLPTVSQAGFGQVGKGLTRDLPIAVLSSASPKSANPTSGGPGTSRQASNSTNTKLPSSHSHAAKTQAPNRNQAVITKPRVEVDQSANLGIWGQISSFFGWNGPSPVHATNQTASNSRKMPTSPHRSSQHSKGRSSVVQLLAMNNTNSPKTEQTNRNKGASTSRRSDTSSPPGILRVPKASGMIMDRLSNLINVSGPGTKKTGESSKHAQIQRSSTSEVAKPTSMRRREIVAKSSPGKVFSGPNRSVAHHHKDLLRRYTRDLVWRNTNNPGITSALSTVTAKPLPSPPKNELQNRVARKTIAKNPSLFQITTPIKVDVFEKCLKNHPNQPFVKSVVRGLRKGFWPWADTGNPKLPTTHDNSCRPAGNAKFIRQQRDEEVKLGRWSKSFGKKLLPGMYSSPITAVPKSTPGKFRLIIDQSRGPHSLNSMIPRSQVKVKLDNIHDLGTTLIAARKKHGRNRKLVLFKSDVKSAYRLMPMHPLWQIRQVATVDGKRYVDRCNTFGNRAGGWIWDSFISLVHWIGKEKEGIPDLHGYVDDDFSWEFANNKKYYKPYGKHLPAKQADYLKLWDKLGVPHEEDKQLFGPSLPIIGYDVDPNAMKVRVPDKKKADVIGLIRNFAHKGRSCTLEQLQSVAGSVNAVLTMYPHFRPHLRVLFNEMAGKEGGKTKLRVTKPIAGNLQQLANFLEHAEGVPIQRIAGDGQGN